MRVTLACADCGQPMRKLATSLPQGEAICHACRAVRRGLSPKRYMPHGDLYCAACGKQMWKGKTSRPQGEASGQQRKYRPNLCADCEKPCIGKRCRQCDAATRRIRSADDYRSKRWQREVSAPGLSEKHRAAIRRKWIKQGRSCAYCAGAATTLDHVVPLVRGGTNYEGNLVPCCRRCNSSKAGRTIVEWRSGRRLPPMREVVFSDSTGRSLRFENKPAGSVGAVFVGSELRNDGEGSGGRGEADRGTLYGFGSQDGNGSQ